MRLTLRLKAVILVLALVALGTGLLLVYVDRIYESEARKHAEAILLRDADQLQAAIRAQERAAAAALAPVFQGGDFLVFLNSGLELKAQFDGYARDWLRIAEREEHVALDVAVVALDSFVAEHRKADPILGETSGGLAICGLARRGFAPVHDDPDAKALSPSEAARLAEMQLRLPAGGVTGATLPSVNAALERAEHDWPGLTADPLLDLLDETLDSETPRSSAVAVGDRVYYAVTIPFREGVQDADAAVLGVAALLFELSDAWLAKLASQPGGYSTHLGRELFIASGSRVTARLGAADADAVYAATRLRSQPMIEFQLGGHVHLAHRRVLGPPAAGVSFTVFRDLIAEIADDVAAARVRIGTVALTLAAAACFVALLLLSFPIRKIEALRRATLEVREGDFDVAVPATGGDELAVLTEAFNDMVQGLKALGLYTDPTIAKDVLDTAELQRNGGTHELGTVLFSDIAGFTTITETTEPQALVEQLNAFFTEAGAHLANERGYLDKFIGDAIMAYWGPPFLETGDFAARASRAALGLQATADEMGERWRAEGKPVFRQRVGLATGKLVVGNLGSATKRNFTVIGDTVNLGARLEGANKLYGTRILCCGATRERAGDAAVFREVDRIRVKGKDVAVGVYEIVALAGDVDEGLRAKLGAYADALAAYRAKDLPAAIDTLTALLAAHGEDGPARWLLGRCVMLATSGQDFEPVTTATSK